MARSKSILAREGRHFDLGGETPMSGKMIADWKDRVGYITISNPARHNAMSLAMWMQMQRILEDFQRGDDLRAIVLTGEGDKAFHSGTDISEFDSQRSTPEEQARHDATVNAAFAAIGAVRVPVIAKIRGWCMGGGLAVALSCDLRVCSDDAQFGTPAAKLGVGYDVQALKKMSDTVGFLAAREILFTGRRYSAEEALRLGIVNRVLPKDDLDGFFDKYVATIVENAPLVIAGSKLMLKELEKELPDRDYEKCRAALTACDTSEDFKEGRRAFMEKRKPQFLGR
jgi:enoyl-CoA hydratase